MRPALAVLFGGLLLFGCIGSEAQQNYEERCERPGEICPNSPLRNVTAPAISGRIEPCETLTAQDGAWESGAALSRQWFSCASADFSSCQPLLGATTPTLKLNPTATGKYVGLRVTAGRGGQQLSEAVTVGPVAAVGPATRRDIIDGFEFEVGSLNVGRESPTFGDVTASYSTVSGGRHGSRLRISSGGSGYLRHLLPAGQQQLMVRLALRLDGSPTSTTTLASVRIGTGDFLVQVASGGWTLAGPSATVALGPASAAASGSWNLLQLSVLLAEGVPVVSARLNGGAAATLTAGANPVAYFELRASPLFPYSIDDLAIAYQPAGVETTLADAAIVPLLPVRLVSATSGISGSFLGNITDPSPNEDSTSFSQTAAGVLEEAIIAFAVPARGAWAARLVYRPQWSGAADYPARFELHRGLDRDVSDPGGTVTPWVSHQAPRAPDGGEWSLCAFEGLTGSWGHATSISAGSPTLYSAYMEAEIPL